MDVSCSRFLLALFRFSIALSVSLSLSIYIYIYFLLPSFIVVVFFLSLSLSLHLSLSLSLSSSCWAVTAISFLLSLSLSLSRFCTSWAVRTTPSKKPQACKPTMGKGFVLASRAASKVRMGSGWKPEESAEDSCPLFIHFWCSGMLGSGGKGSLLLEVLQFSWGGSSTSSDVRWMFLQEVFSVKVLMQENAFKSQSQSHSKKHQPSACRAWETLLASSSFGPNLELFEKNKGRFCKGVVLANVPSFRFLVPSFRFLYPHSGFWYRRSFGWVYFTNIGRDSFLQIPNGWQEL